MERLRITDGPGSAVFGPSVVLSQSGTDIPGSDLHYPALYNPDVSLTIVPDRQTSSRSALTCYRLWCHFRITQYGNLSIPVLCPPAQLSRPCAGNFPCVSVLVLACGRACPV